MKSKMRFGVVHEKDFSFEMSQDERWSLTQQEKDWALQLSLGLFKKRILLQDESR